MKTTEKLRRLEKWTGQVPLGTKGHEAATERAMALHYDLIKMGIEPESDEYWENFE